MKSVLESLKRIWVFVIPGNRLFVGQMVTSSFQQTDPPDVWQYRQDYLFAIIKDEGVDIL